MAAPQVFRFDRQDAIWAGRIAATVSALTHVYMLNQRYEIGFVTGTDKAAEARVGEFISGVRPHRPVIVQHHPDGVVVMCNARRLLVLKPPLIAQIGAYISSIPLIYVIGNWPRSLPLTTKMINATPGENTREQLRERSVNSTDWIDPSNPQNQKYAVETFRGLFVRALDCISADLTGGVDTRLMCTECRKPLQGADATVHFIAEHLTPKEFFKPMPGLAAGRFFCTLCNEKGITGDGIVTHLAVMHEDQIIAAITAKFPRAVAVFSSPIVPVELDTTGHLDGGSYLMVEPTNDAPADRDATFWAKLRFAERRLGPVSPGADGSIANLVKRLAAADLTSV